jgi:hypothetical protein
MVGRGVGTVKQNPGRLGPRRATARRREISLANGRGRGRLVGGFLAEVTAMTDSCPRCGNGALVPGKCMGWHLGVATRFEPGGLRFFQPWRLRRHGVPLRDGFTTCPACGLVWSALEPDDLRALIEEYGTDETRARMPPRPPGPA